MAVSVGVYVIGVILRFDPIDVILKYAHIHTIPFSMGLLTSLFLHGGLFHLLFNMLYLHIFGDNVEDRMGGFNLLLFYISCGLFAGLFESLIQFPASVSSIGASGAIAGIMAAYWVLCPQASIRVFFMLKIFSVPAGVYLGGWVLMQAIGSYVAYGKISRVGWFAHLGGFCFGWLIAKMLVEFRQIKRAGLWSVISCFLAGLAVLLILGPLNPSVPAVRVRDLFWWPPFNERDSAGRVPVAQVIFTSEKNVYHAEDKIVLRCQLYTQRGIRSANFQMNPDIENNFYISAAVAKNSSHTAEMLWVGARRILYFKSDLLTLTLTPKSSGRFNVYPGELLVQFVGRYGQSATLRAEPIHLLVRP